VRRLVASPIAKGKAMPEITPFLWFNDNAEEAATFYQSVFPSAEILGVKRKWDGKALTVSFRLEGQEFVGLNGGPHFKFNEAVSFVVDCESQDEVDRYWTLLTADGGSPSRCGWLKDRFGLSWQIVPRQMVTWLSDPDPARSKRTMAAMMTMGKLDLAALKRAYDGE
jgi:predicted 3-demethylubiquinone-9 3-methyltransferase (glyoxalase superfamily)